LSTIPQVETLEDRTLLAFSPPLVLPTVGSPDPRAIITGDFNGDGKPDLVLENGDNTLSVLLGLGNGNFTPAGGPISGGRSVVAGDFNRDGRLDLAAANTTSNSVNLLLGNGAGGFITAVGSPFSVGGRGPVALAVGDFNLDSLLDLASANATANSVSVLLGDVLSVFVQGAGSPFAAGGVNPSSITAGDFNNDFLLDLVVVNANSNAVQTFLGNGSGGFVPGASSPFPAGGGGTWSVAVGDFNGDSILDLAVANTTSSSVTVLLGNGVGGFFQAAGSPFAIGGSVAAGDFDGNGTLDLAVASPSGNAVNVLLGDGFGLFVPDPASPYATGGANPTAITSGDFNGDGTTDLAVANASNTLSVFLNVLGPSVLVPPVVFPVYAYDDLYGPRPNPDANSAFVRGLYRSLLNRDGEATGVAIWVSQLNAGAARSDVVLSFIRSPEHRGLQVDFYYNRLLGRAADAAGRAFWVSQLLAGMDETQVIAGFLTSAEYTASHATNAAFVQGLYQQLLQRSPDTGGAAAWQQALNSGLSRSEVALSFLFSAEGTGKEVGGYYVAYLRRPPDPAAQSWSAALQTRQTLSHDQVVAAILGSQEFFNNAQAATP
jgi:hypothetical protein